MNEKLLNVNSEKEKTFNVTVLTVDGTKDYNGKKLEVPKAYPLCKTMGAKGKVTTGFNTWFFFDQLEVSGGIEGVHNFYKSIANDPYKVMIRGV